MMEVLVGLALDLKEGTDWSVAINLIFHFSCPLLSPQVSVVVFIDENSLIWRFLALFTIQPCF